MILIIIIDIFFRSIFSIRKKYHNSTSRSFKRFYAILNDVYLNYYGSYIGLSTQFAGTPLFPHKIKGVFISGEATVGKNCIIFQQVTIGSNSIPFSKNIGAPNIGDNCYIGAGAKIIGGVKVGNNVRIGANCVITEDIPADSTVVLARPVILTNKNFSTNKFYFKESGEWVYFENGSKQREKDIDIINNLNSNFSE